MSHPSRRGILGGFAALTAAISPSSAPDDELPPSRVVKIEWEGKPLPEWDGDLLAVTTPEYDPDGELIRVCAELPALIAAANVMDEPKDAPTWAAYEAARDFITAARPVTLAGLIAKAQAAKAEAASFPRSEEEDQFQGALAGQWAWNLVCDLVLLGGGA